MIYQSSEVGIRTWKTFAQIVHMFGSSVASVALRSQTMPSKMLNLTGCPRARHCKLCNVLLGTAEPSASHGSVSVPSK
ncbi:hypothetical protein A0H81_09211 [Grifola frondosa]|uniref:Uncharacterized protein n=1 Tax=Grifola frondosa TaxID=5627 RepID=A0A1C7M362_GRIFR|nr:hypothetical protein A0H81_09211 [Grifola frondosa]